jgi:hypothetical protein
MMGATSNGGDASRQQPLLQGYLHKIHKRNTKRQKYFVIFDDAPDKPGTGRLEYFDSEKKFRSAMEKNRSGGITNEKRSIILCTCFNINRRCDTKYKNVIGLYRKDDTFSIMAKDESECNLWLKQMLILQRGKESVDADQPRPTFGEYKHTHIIEFIFTTLCQVMPIRSFFFLFLLRPFALTPRPLVHLLLAALLSRTCSFVCCLLLLRRWKIDFNWVKSQFGIFFGVSTGALFTADGVGGGVSPMT